VIQQIAIAVVGGGPAGSICARELARQGHSVVLLEREIRACPRPGETCGPGLSRVLDGLCGLRVPPAIFAPLPSFFSVWGDSELDNRSFRMWQAADGLVLDRSAFDEWLLGTVAEAGVIVLRGCTVREARSEGDRLMLSGFTSEGPVAISAGFLVEATGRVARSVVQPGVGRFFTDALVCVSVEALGPTSGSLAGVESCATGWWYTVRLPDFRQLIALFTDADLVSTRGTRLEWLQGMLDAALHMRRLAPAIPAGARVRVWDARTSVRKVLWRTRCLSIGDAAWCLDPLSGTGIERAIKSGLESASAISHAIRTGDFEVLRSFAVSEAHAFRHSLTIQARFYARELRWRNEVFWRRRAVKAAQK
jgi:flavin-dependent dehydrogenase